MSPPSPPSFKPSTTSKPPEEQAKPLPIRQSEKGEILVSRLRVRDGDVSLERRSSTDTFALPRRMHPTDAGFDLESCQSMLVPSGQSARIPHNLAVAIPEGYYGLIVPRSSTLARTGLIIIPGTIDQDFRGELQTVVFNTMRTMVQIVEHERLSQLLILPLISMKMTEINSIEERLPPGISRGTEGWGSTGGLKEKGERR